MVFNFTFKTEAELLEAELLNPNILFKIVRVVVEKFNKQIWDIPLRTESEYKNYESKIKYNKDKFIKVYSALDTFNKEIPSYLFE